MADKLNPEAIEYFRKQGKRGGKIGAKARMVKLTPEQRTEIARNAGRNRWKNGAIPKPAAPTPARSVKKAVDVKKKGRQA